MVEGIFALLGVALGAALTAFLGVWRDSRHRDAERLEARRHETLELVSRFLRDADLAWLAQQGLGRAIVEIQADPKSGVGDRAREEAFAEMRGPLQDAMLAIGRMRLTHPSLVDPSSALLAAQELYRIDNHT